ncbi:MAG: hypothetical protein M3P33_02350, partial [bacterium]|nr:hypothetical protein [bacterium]
LAVIMYFYNTNQKVMVASNQAVSTIAKSSVVTLPKDAVKISGCIPFMGDHYIQPSKLPNGPFYTTYNNKVTSIEFMFEASTVPGEKEAKMSQKDAMAMIQKHNLSFADLVKEHDFGFDLMNLSYDYLTLNWSAPHSGTPVPHFDLHLYLVSRAETKNICPDAKLEEVYSPEVMENIQKYKIPFPAAFDSK